MSDIAWEDFTRLSGAPVTVTVQGRVRSADDGPAGPEQIEVFSCAPPDLVRVEDGEGHLVHLADEAGYHQWPAGGAGTACFAPRRPRSWTSGGAVCTGLVRPRPLLGAADDDFTRPAWRVLLQPPPRKPRPVWQVLDVASGVTLAYLDPDGAAVVEFTAIATGVDLPAGVFRPR